MSSGGAYAGEPGNDRKAFANRQAWQVAVAAAASALVFMCALGSASAQSPDAQYRKLPAEVRHYAESVRKSCIDLNPHSKPYDLMQGIDPVELGGAPALFVDAETLCNARMAGANCTNRGCDLKIWKRVGPQRGERCSTSTCSENSSA